MKKQICFCALMCLLVLAACHRPEKEYYLFTSFHEPATDGLRLLYSEDGLHWDSIPGVWLLPQVGKQQLMRDPSMVCGPDGTYHLVWTTSWKGDTGFGYACSKNLIQWSEQRFLPVMSHEPTTVNVWAPELFYDDERGRFMIVWASCIPHRFERGIEDEDNNHRLYYVTTEDFKTFSETRLLFDPGFSSIDAVLLKHAPGDYVMVLKDNTRPCRNLKVSFAPSPEGPWSEPSEAFTEEFVEGPSVVRMDDSYLVYFDMYRKHIYGAVRTADFISFTDVTSEISIPHGHKHGTIFRAPASIVKTLLNHPN